MNQGNSVFAQLLRLIPFHHFEHLVDKYQSNKGVTTFSAWSHLVCLLYAQLTRRSGLRDLVACLNAQKSKLYHLGIRHAVSRSTLAEAAERRDYRLFEGLAERLITSALALYADEDTGLGIKAPIYAMDSTTIDLCLNLFPWAHFRSSKSAVKAHVVVDLRGAIPVFINISTGKVHDVNLLDALNLPKGSILVIDRGYIDFKRLHALHLQGIGFVTRAKKNMRYTWISSRQKDRKAGICADQNILLHSPSSKAAWSSPLRRISFRDEETGKHLVFLTNLFDLPAIIIAALYKKRWQIEIFFKWLKQNLAVSHFFGNSENAVKAQIWIAICAYLLLVIAIKQLRLPVTPQIFLHLIETNIFEKIMLNQMVENAIPKKEDNPFCNQLILF